jgi:riboflavin synthase
VNGVFEDAFDVVLIPHTQSVVHLHTKPVGARVNLEADVIGKYVERLLAPRLGHTPAGATEGHSSGISLDMLAKHGFVRGVGG